VGKANWICSACHRLKLAASEVLMVSLFADQLNNGNFTDRVSHCSASHEYIDHELTLMHVHVQIVEQTETNWKRALTKLDQLINAWIVNSKKLVPVQTMFSFWLLSNGCAHKSYRTYKLFLSLNESAKES